MITTAHQNRVPELSGFSKPLANPHRVSKLSGFSKMLSSIHLRHNNNSRLCQQFLCLAMLSSFSSVMGNDFDLHPTPAFVDVMIYDNKMGCARVVRRNLLTDNEPINDTHRRLVTHPAVPPKRLHEASSRELSIATSTPLTGLQIRLQRLQDSEVVSQYQKGMENTAEQRWKDYELVTMVKNMLNTLVSQYNEFEYEKKMFETEHSEEIKKKGKYYEELENMRYKSDKMVHLLKRFHVEIETPKERYEHVTTRAKIWKGVKTTVKLAVALTHAVGGNFAMISNQVSSFLKQDSGHIAALGLIGDHIKDLDFTLSAAERVVGYVQEETEFVEKNWANFTQKTYPLKYVRQMKKQLESIQDTVQAIGMKPAERQDWAGVRMQLIRIFQQEQFIFRKVDQNEKPIKAKEAFYGGTRDPNALVKRILFKINRTYKVTDHLAQQRIITYKYKKNISKEIENIAHCVKIMYNRKDKRTNIMYKNSEDAKKRYDDSYYLGFIQLKDYMKLSEVADILGAGPEAGQLNRSPVERKHMNNTDCAIEACEVRGRTEDIFSGKWHGGKCTKGIKKHTTEKKCTAAGCEWDNYRLSIKQGKSEKGHTTWGAFHDWFTACRSSAEYKKDTPTKWQPIHEYVPKSVVSETKRCTECSKCSGEGTVSCTRFC